MVAIHNKNGKGLLPAMRSFSATIDLSSQSTIKMEKGYYKAKADAKKAATLSQSTIKMEKGYYTKYISICT